jgi:hypothetical protein
VPFPPYSNNNDQQHSRRAVVALWHAFLLLGLWFSPLSSFCLLLVASAAFSYDKFLFQE